MALGLVAKGIMGAGKAASGAKMAKNMFKRKGGKDAPDVPASEQTIDVKATTVEPTTPLVPTMGSAKGISKATSPTGKEDLVGTAFRVKTTLVDVDTLLRGSFALDKIRESERRKKEGKKGTKKQEKELESATKKNNSKFGLGRLVPTKAKSIFGNIINFFVTLLLGKLALSLLDNIPLFEKIAQTIAAVGKFIVDWGGKLFNTLVSFIDFGYNMVDGLRNKVGDMFGEKGMKTFDQLSNVFKVFLNTALIAAMVGSKMAMGGMGLKGAKKGVKRLLNPKRAAKLKRLKNIKKIKADRLLRVKKIGRLKKFAKAKQFVGKGIDLGKNIVKTGSKLTRTATKGITTAAKSTAKTATTVAKTTTKGITSAAKTATTTATKLGKTGLKTGLKGLKALKKVVSPIVKKIPFIGALLDFVLNYFVFKEPLGRAAFMAIGAGLAAWLGGIVGSVVPVGGTLVGAALGGWAGDKLAGALYDAIFKKKEPKEGDKEEDKKKPEMKELTGEDKRRALAKLEYHKERNQLRRSYGRNSDEVKALEKEYMESMSNTYPSSITGNTNTTKYQGLDKQASYEEEGTTTYVVSQKGSSSGGEETSSGTNEKVTKMSEGLILSNSGSESNNSYDVLAKR